MKKVIKQVLGIDVAQKELVVCLASMYEDLTREFNARKSFENSRSGFKLMLKWVEKLTDASVRVRYVMEATGVYHESLAYFLTDNGMEVSVVLPNKISNYLRTLEIKTITDKTASDAIAQFGIERQLDVWVKPLPIYKKMRQLTRERGQLVQERTMAKNQQHAEEAEAEPNATSIKRVNDRIKLINSQIKEINAELSKMVNEDEKIKNKVKLVCSIPGVGLLTAATILAETNGFELIRNKRQLTSYAGLDVKEKQSGTSVNGKTRISKRGNRYLRKAMHFPALTAIKHDERFKNIFIRLVSRHGIKMKAAVAVQRKLLELTYTVFQSKKAYDRDYFKHQYEKTVAECSKKLEAV